MTVIDPSARVAHGAVIGKDVTIGPYCVIEAECRDRRRLPPVLACPRHRPHDDRRAHRDLSVRFARHAAAIGQVSRRADQARHRRRLRDPRKRHHEYRHRRRRRLDARSATNACSWSASHVGHDCIVGNNVTMANNAVLGGHCMVEDYVIFGGHSAVHQFVRIGEGAMIAGMTGIGADVIPFGFAIGQRGVLDGLNVVGMRRRGYSRFDIQRLRQAYRSLFMMPRPSQGSHRGGRARIRVRSGGGQDRRFHPRRRAAAADESVADGAGRRSRRGGRRDLMNDAVPPVGTGPVAIICGGGSFPFTVADALIRQGPAARFCSRCTPGPMPKRSSATRITGCASGSSATSCAPRARKVAAT